MKKILIVMTLALIGLVSCEHPTYQGYHTIEESSKFVVASITTPYGCSHLYSTYHIILSSSQECKDTILVLTQPCNVETSSGMEHTPCSYKVGDIVELKKK